MARVHPIFANFTSGELSPLLYSRVDFDKYVSGLRRLENMIVHPHGPASRRAGTKFVAEVKDSTKRTYVLPFQFSTEQAYVVEFGPLYMRFYKDGGRIEDPPGTVIEATHVYTEDQLPSVKYIQSADTMYFFHVAVTPQKLIRTSHTEWTMKTVRFLPPATFDSGIKPAAQLTLGAVTGLGITVTADSAVFLAADVGRLISQDDARAIITAFTSTTVVTVDIVDDFADVTVPSGDWTLEGSPNTNCTPSVKGPRHASCTVTLAAAGWRLVTDVGRYVRINKGVVRLNAVTSTTVARGEIVSALSEVTVAPGGSWSIEDAAWSAERGFPQAASFHEQRMVVAGSLFQSQSLWGSASADIENFGLAPDDDDAFEFKIAANEVNTIVWLVATRVLLIGTTSSEFTAAGGSDNPITPTNITVRSETARGSSNKVRPLRIAHAAIFATRAEKEIHEILFSVDRDSYISNNLLILAEHLTRDSGVTELAFRKTPHSTILATRADGVLLTCTYQRDHNVIAWARQITKGKYESVTVIPHWDGARDVAWYCVNRTISGGTKRFIEFDDETGGFYGAVNTDSSLTGTFAAGATVLTGLDHLEGEEVQIVGDGAVYPVATVAGGSVTLNGPAAVVIEVGLAYTSLLETMRPEVPLQGTSQGRLRHWSEIIVRLDRSLGCFVNGDEIPFRSSGDDMDEPPPIFTGDHKINDLGRDTDATITVEQRQPLPLTVVGVFGTLGVGD